MLSNEKPVQSRQYLFVRFADTSFDLGDADVHRVAFMPAGAEPGEDDWLEGIVVTEGHPLFREDVGEAFALLVGPDRGDVVDTVDLDPGIHQVWSDSSVPESDERIVELHGTVTIVSAEAE